MKHNLRIYNTLSGKKEIFKPMKGKKVNIFVCGATVYDYSHIGHARNFIVFDSFVKYLRKIGYSVFYLQNITDLDDKIIARARERGVTPKDLASAFEKEHLENMKMLGIDSVSKYAKATNYIKDIISQVSRLEKKGFVYIIEGDGLYFNIANFKGYGKLSGRSALQAEDSVSRIDYSKDKKNRGDFCVWKFSIEGEPSWKSPWGDGRPGWHIEDTAITEKFFGPQYDIHGGARDLIFPHHEAELTQMEAISGKVPMVKYWMHVGFLTIEGEKMSKSVGNTITITDFLKRCPPNYLRFFVAKNLWSSPVDYSESMMIEVKATVEKIEEFLRRLISVKTAKSSKSVMGLIKNFSVDFYKELDDDFNTPRAFAAMFDVMKKINELMDSESISHAGAKKIYVFFQEIDSIFGIINFKKVNRTIPAEIKKLVKAREAYRNAKEWDKSDQVRMELEKKGFTVEDTKSGPVVREL